MPDFESVESIAYAFTLLCPGFLIMYGRSRFLTGRMTSVASSVFEYLMATSIYFAIIYPFAIELDWSLYAQFLIFLILLPLTVGLIIGLCSQKEIFKPLKKFLRLNPVHYSPTAWDYCFGNLTGDYWVVVKLFSGGTYYGVFGPKSMASSDIDKTDIYLENVCDEDFKFVEQRGRNRGVWINHSDIRSIEIVKD